jgi:hypothetical protein
MISETISLQAKIDIIRNKKPKPFRLFVSDRRLLFVENNFYQKIFTISIIALLALLIYSFYSQLFSGISRAEANHLLSNTLSNYIWGIILISIAIFVVKQILKTPLDVNNNHNAILMNKNIPSILYSEIVTITKEIQFQTRCVLTLKFRSSTIFKQNQVQLVMSVEDGRTIVEEIKKLSSKYRPAISFNG